MISRTSTQIPSLPGTLVHLLVDVVARWNVTPDQLFNGSGLSPEILSETVWQVELPVLNHLIERAIELTGEPGIGLHMGVQATVSFLGIIGLAAMFAKDLRECLSVLNEFISQHCIALQAWVEEDNNGMAYFYIHQPLPNIKLHDACIICLMVGLGKISDVLTGKTLTGIGEFVFDQPEYYDRLKKKLHSNARFSQDHNRIVFKSNYLDFPIISADPMAARLARDQCKLILNSASHDSVTVTSLVRELVYDEVQGFSGIADVAKKLQMSQRTLQRKLADENTTFKDIIDKFRLEKSLLFLRNKKLSVATISDYAGYSDATNFIRAFKRWKGLTPSQYRLTKYS